MALPPMRRKERALDSADALSILDQAVYGTLALQSTDGPYAVPLNFARIGRALYFHVAPQGFKLELMEQDGRAAFSAVTDVAVDAPRMTTLYRSAMAFGALRRVEDEAEAIAALNAIAAKYAPQVAFDAVACANRKRVTILRMDIAHLTAKGNFPA
nr:pyridoxamine 5'-phosphate oxidase family protein [bacterium]